MKKFFQIFGFVTYVLVVILVMGMLVFSVFTGKQIKELLNWDWWVLFFAVDLWATIKWKEISKDI